MKGSSMTGIAWWTVLLSSERPVPGGSSGVTEWTDGHSSHSLPTGVSHFVTLSCKRFRRVGKHIETLGNPFRGMTR